MLDWQPIESAPLDEKVILYWPNLFDGPYVTAGMWCKDGYAKHPRPFWGCDGEAWIGRTLLRANPPTHWAKINLPD